MNEAVKNPLAILIAGLALLLAGISCAPAKPERELTERERDSILARSSLPGAAVVGRAMAVSDRSARRAAAMDSLPGGP
jgi:hypothetical protein